MEGFTVFFGLLLLGLGLAGVWSVAATSSPGMDGISAILFPCIWLLAGLATSILAFAVNDKLPVPGAVLLIPFAVSLVGYALFLSPRILRGTVNDQSGGQTFINRTRRLDSFVGIVRYFEARDEYLAIMKVLSGAELPTVRRALRDTRGLHLDKVYGAALREFLTQFAAQGWPQDAKARLSNGLDDISKAIRAHGSKTVQGYLALGLSMDAAAAAIEAGIPLEYAAAMGLPE